MGLLVILAFEDRLFRLRVVLDAGILLQSTLTAVICLLGRGLDQHVRALDLELRFLECLLADDGSRIAVNRHFLVRIDSVIGSHEELWLGHREVRSRSVHASRRSFEHFAIGRIAWVQNFNRPAARAALRSLAVARGVFQLL